LTTTTQFQAHVPTATRVGSPDTNFGAIHNIDIKCIIPVSTACTHTLVAGQSAAKDRPVVIHTPFIAARAANVHRAQLQTRRSDNICKFSRGCGGGGRRWAHTVQLQAHSPTTSAVDTTSTHLEPTCHSHCENITMVSTTSPEALVSSISCTNDLTWVTHALCVGS